MERYDQIYRLYRDFDTETLEAYQDFVDLFPPVDSRVALDHWEEATDELERRKAEIRDGFDEEGGVYADLAAALSRDQAFTALDLATEYERPINALVLDVDETLRTAGQTDNEIPATSSTGSTSCTRTGCPSSSVPGRPWRTSRDSLIQGWGTNSSTRRPQYRLRVGQRRVHARSRPGHEAAPLRGPRRRDNGRVRGRALAHHHRSPDEDPTGLSPPGQRVQRDAEAERGDRDTGGQRSDRSCVGVRRRPAGRRRGRTGRGRRRVERDGGRPGVVGEGALQPDPEIAQVLRSRDALPDVDADDAPEDLARILERIDVAYYEADAAEIVSLELDKAAGVEAAFDVLGVEDPFALVMGDSKSDLRVMQWLEERDAGLAAAPKHSSRDVLDHVIRTDELLFDEGDAASVLELVAGTNLFAELDG